MARAITHKVEEAALAAGTSKRFAARLGALARVRVFISDVVLELLEEGDAAKPLQGLLFAPALLEKAANLTAQDFQAVYAIHQQDAFFDENPLQLIVAGDARLIALSDEAPGIDGLEDDQSSQQPPQASASAKPAAQAQASGQPKEPVSTSELIRQVRESGGSPVLSDDETSALFSGDQVAEIKLVLLTSTGADQKVEAVRRLWLSPISVEAKVRLFIIALRDESPRVRAEAAKGLGGLGMDARATENLARACSGEIDERLVSLSNIAHLFDSLDEREQALTVSVIVGLIVSREDKRVLGEVLSVLTATMPRFAKQQPSLVADVHARLQELLLVKRADLLPAARKLYRALMDEVPEQLAATLQEALSELAPVYLRSFYLSLIAVSGTPVAHERRTIELLLDAMVEIDEFDPSYITLNASMQELGTRVLDVLLDVLANTPDRRKARLLGILADICRSYELQAEQIDEIARVLLDIFESADSELRNQVYECGILRTNAFSSELRARATRLMLDDMHEHELESSRELVGGNIMQLGGPSFPVLLERVFSATHESTAVTACNLLGETMERWADTPEVSQGVNHALDQLLPLVEEEELPDRGAVFRTIGRLGAHKAVDEARSHELIELLSDRIGTSSASYDIIEGLGWLASGDTLREGERLELCHTLLSFLQARLPQMRGDLRDRADESVLHFGSETTAYVDMIPRLLEAFGRILERDDLAQGLWKHIVDVLAELFGKCARYELVWAPASVLKLAGILGAAAQNQRIDTPMREQIVDLLLIKSNMVAIARLLAHVAMSDDTPRMNLLAVEALDHLEENLTADEQLDPLEQRSALRALARLLERDQIGNDASQDKRGRQRILDLLYAALKNKLHGTADILRGVAEGGKAKGIPLDEISRRLERINR